jgi:hypothetical protein
MPPEDDLDFNSKHDKNEHRNTEITSNSFKIFLKQIEIFDFK